MDEKICKLVAEIYAGRNWRGLSDKEQELVKLLEENRYIIPIIPANGFVGKIFK